MADYTTGKEALPQWCNMILCISGRSVSEKQLCTAFFFKCVMQAPVYRWRELTPTSPSRRYVYQVKRRALSSLCCNALRGLAFVL